MLTRVEPEISFSFTLASQDYADVKAALLVSFVHLGVLYDKKCRFVWYLFKSRYARCYSLFNDLIGFTVAARIAWKLTVIKVITTAPNAAIPNTHQEISVWYLYCCNQPCR